MEPYGVSGPEAGSPRTCPAAMGALLTEGLTGGCSVRSSVPGVGTGPSQQEEKVKDTADACCECQRFPGAGRRSPDHLPGGHLSVWEAQRGQQPGMSLTIRDRTQTGSPRRSPEHPKGVPLQPQRVSTCLPQDGRVKPEGWGPILPGPLPHPDNQPDSEVGEVRRVRTRAWGHTAGAGRVVPRPPRSSRPAGLQGPLGSLQEGRLHFTDKVRLLRGTWLMNADFQQRRAGQQKEGPSVYCAGFPGTVTRQGAPVFPPPVQEESWRGGGGRKAEEARG